MRLTEPVWAKFITWLVWLLLGWPLLLIGAYMESGVLGDIGLAIILISGIYLLIIVTRKR